MRPGQDSQMLLSCVFPSKDSREEAVLGSIPLPSYVISPVAPEDRISRKYSFKVLSFFSQSVILRNSVLRNTFMDTAALGEWERKLGG